MSERGNVPVRDLPAPPVITIASRVSVGAALGKFGAPQPASGGSPFAANDMNAFPFILTAPTKIEKAFWVNGSAAGSNYASAIYDADYNKLIQSASTGGTGNSVPQAVAMAIKLPAGLYYCALATDASVTDRLFRWVLATTGPGFFKMFGCWRQASVTLATLPNPATPVAINLAAYGLHGLITRSVFDA